MRTTAYGNALNRPSSQIRPVDATKQQHWQRYRKLNQPLKTTRASGWPWAIAGMALAAAAVAVQVKTRQAESRNQPQGSFIIIDGVRLHYTDQGSGDPVVLLHGNGSMINDFESSGLVELAAASYRVIAFDRPGYGHSDRPGDTTWTPTAQAALIVKALKKLQIDKPIVVGHSWGSLVATAMGLDHPTFVRGLVLLSGYYYPTARLDVPVLALPAVPIIGTVMRYTISPLISRLLWPAIVKRLFSPAAVSPTFKDFPKWMALRPSQLQASAAESALLVPAAYSLRKRYKELVMPVVIMAGEEDKIVDTSAHSERLHAELPQSALHLVPGDGHMIHHLVPYEVMNAIDAAVEAA